MILLICAPGRDHSGLVQRIGQLAPDLDVRVWPDVGCPQAVDFAVVWKHPAGLLRELTGLKAVSSLGAGVEHLLNDPDLPPNLPVGRLVGPRLAADMAGYLVAQILGDWRRLDRFPHHQRRKQWRPWAPDRPPQVGLLGFGRMGKRAARAFKALKVPVAAWRRSAGAEASIPLHHGRHGLETLAGWSNYLVCLLPLTDHTREILDQELFRRMKPDSVLINVGRGEHLVEKDLLDALSKNRPRLAILDVFGEEPLPPQHPFWSHPAVRITPHCASLTQPAEAAELIVASVRRVQAGRPPLDPVQWELGY